MGEHYEPWATVSEPGSPPAIVSVDYRGARPAAGDHVAVPAALYSDLAYLAGWAQASGAPAAVVERVLAAERLVVVRFGSAGGSA